MKFPWAKGTTLQQAVIAGIPSQLDPAAVEEAKKQLRAEAQAERLAKQARAAAKREKAYAVRAIRREAILDHVASQLTAAERGRWSSMLALIRSHAIKRKSTSADLKIDLADVLPADLAARCGLPPDPTSTVAPKNWERRPYPANLVADTQPAASNDYVVTAEDIVNAAKRARGDIPPENQLDPGKAVKPSARWLRK
jgi:hypothetical protein